MSSIDNITVRLAGESGEGVISAGDILTTGAAENGYWVHTFRTYPAEIRGGPCMYQVRIGHGPVTARGDSVDLLMCFNQEGYDLQHADVGPDGIVVYDQDGVNVDEWFEGRSLAVALGEVAREATGGGKRGKNLVAVGLAAGLFGMSTEKIEAMILRRYAHKGDVGEANISALRAGVASARDASAPNLKLRGPDPVLGPRVLMSGNQAISLGALAAGVDYFAGYPITPASDILEWLSGRLAKFGGVAIQTEDEISALASVIGASYAGAKAMTATSGPGLSLMSELIGLAGMAEIPAVIIDSQRAGPSTGMPTKTEQSDLNHALYGGHGEAPRVVMAPTCVADCFRIMVDAVGVAEKYQVPVLVLTDQSLSHRMESIERPDADGAHVEQRVLADVEESNGFRRYRLTESGISPMSVPGGPGTYVSTGIEHDEEGHPRYEPELHEAMMRKRLRKLSPLEHAERAVAVDGREHADVGILGWGSTHGAALEAADQLAGLGLSASVLYPRILMPLPRDRIRVWAAGMGRIIVPEVNATGQFARLVRSDCEIKVHSLTNVSGLPFTAAEITKFAREVKEAEYATY